ncbi:MAG: transposase [Planctomycetota bacterium]|nr:transposase [Planctomycetota bacterium]
MVCKLQSRTTKALEPGMVEIDDKIINALISINMDKTRIRFKGKLAYIWVAVCKWAVKYLIGPRSRLSFDKLVGKPLGVVSSVRYPVYSHLEVKFRQLCWSHLVRDFLVASEKKNKAGEIGKRLFKTGIQILRIWKRVREGTLSRNDFIKNYLGRYRKRIRGDLELARAYPKRKLGIVAKNLLDPFKSLWQFAHVEGLNRLPTRPSANFGNW